MTDMFNALAKPFPASVISWRSQSLTRDGTKAMALCYIDARDVMRRLDEVCGPAGWQDSYTETPRGRLLCTISILCGDHWIAKSDGAGDTDVEGEKGAISDAFKRCAVKWGVGRYLYDMDAIWAECETYEKNGKKVFSKWTPRGIATLNNAAGKVVAPILPTNEPMDTDNIGVISALSQASGVSIQDICEGYKVSSLDELNEIQCAATIRNLRKRIADPQQVAA